MLSSAETTSPLPASASPPESPVDDVDELPPLETTSGASVFVRATGCGKRYAGAVAAAVGVVAVDVDVVDAPVVVEPGVSLFVRVSASLVTPGAVVVVPYTGATLTPVPTFCWPGRLVGSSGSVISAGGSVIELCPVLAPFTPYGPVERTGAIGWTPLSRPGCKSIPIAPVFVIAAPASARPAPRRAANRSTSCWPRFPRRSRRSPRPARRLARRRLARSPRSARRLPRLARPAARRNRRCCTALAR